MTAPRKTTAAKVAATTPVATPAGIIDTIREAVPGVKLVHQDMWRGKVTPGTVRYDATGNTTTATMTAQYVRKAGVADLGDPEHVLVIVVALPE